MITRRRESGLKGKITKGRVSENFLNGVEFWKKKIWKEKLSEESESNRPRVTRKNLTLTFSIISSFDVFSPFP